MKEEKKQLFGFGVNDTRLFPEVFDTVEELIKFAQEEYDGENGTYFDEDQHCILVSYVERVCALDFAPSLDDIAEQMTDRFYCEHAIDDFGEVDFFPKDEAQKAWRDLVEKYFDIPCNLIGYADVGWYDLKEHKWLEKK